MADLRPVATPTETNTGVAGVERAVSARTAQVDHISSPCAASQEAGGRKQAGEPSDTVHPACHEQKTRVFHQGESPDAVKVARPVRREGSGNGLADWRSTPRLCPYPTGGHLGPFGSAASWPPTPQSLPVREERHNARFAVGWSVGRDRYAHPCGQHTARPAAHSRVHRRWGERGEGSSLGSLPAPADRATWGLRLHA